MQYREKKAKVTKTYKKGRKKEYEIVNHFKELGCYAARIAGSHSEVDVIVIDKTRGVIKLIQAKNTKKQLSQNARQLIISRGSELNGNYEVEFQLWD